VGFTPAIEITYRHEASLLDPVGPICAPLHPTPEDIGWLLANGGETGLTISLKPSGLVAGAWNLVPNAKSDLSVVL
jgi:hypothetical protein